jgi:DNA repair protein RadD
MMIALRDYQARDFERLREALRADPALLYVAPTGSGKTVLFCFVALGAVARGKRVWVVVHRQELVDQTSRSLTALNIAHGIVAPDHPRTNDPVQVCSVGTLLNRIRSGGVGRTDLVVIDEAHHATAETWLEVIRWALASGAKVLGVTATPDRLDGKGLGTVFQRMVVGPSVRELMEAGWLARYKLYAPPLQFDLRGVHRRGGDFARDQLAERMDRPSITGDAVDHYARLCAGAPAIVFCVSVAHAEHVAESFRARGFRSQSVDGTLDREVRRQRIDGLRTGQVQVLTSCELVSEGLDVPSVVAAILLRPTDSLVLYLQQVGRALRPGKDLAIILDHVGNATLRHGLPDEDRIWSLDGRQGRKARGVVEPTVQVKQCPTCFAAHQPAPTCPWCGHVYVPERELPKKVKGQLSEVDAAQVEAARRERKREIGRAQTREELERIAAARGYAPGWVHFILRSRGMRRGAR